MCGCGDTPFRSAWTGLSHRLPAGDPIPAEAVAEGLAETGGPALRLRVGGRTAQAALVSEQGERRLWRAGAGIVVSTDGGRVVATSGLREVLVATRFDGPDPLASPAELLDRPAEARRLVDLMRSDREPQGMRFGIPVRCRLRAAPLPEDAAVLLVEERCRAGGAGGGAHTNRFWSEAATGTVLRGEQWVGPNLPPMTVEFLPPAAEELPAVAGAARP
ncbi:MAG: YjbF family lipoprotein [Acetobacteraceae bacterium]|nr:YjbF family lipoprotein [Acetobacteraceae bacterium]